MCEAGFWGILSRIGVTVQRLAHNYLEIYLGTNNEKCKLSTIVAENLNWPVWNGENSF